jgi:hypothetical protein
MADSTRSQLPEFAAAQDALGELAEALERRLTPGAGAGAPSTPKRSDARAGPFA